MSPSRGALDWLDDELAELAGAGLLRQQAARLGPQGPRIVLEGRELVQFGSNDYLSLAADERIVSAAIAAVRGEGWGSGASPLVAGRSSAVCELELRLAEFEGTESALVFSSGFAANLAAIPALVGRGDAIFADSKNHASLIDGCRLSRAEVHVYPHIDSRRLAALLDHCASQYRRRLIVTDSLFSMDGDMAPLAQLAYVAERYDAMLLVDEAHATGVFGAQGRGVVELAGVERRVHVRVGTLSKSLGGIGGFVCGTRSLIHWLVNRARPYVFSTAPPAAGCAAALAALDVVQREPERRVRLLERAAWLRAELRQRGWNLGAAAGQIVPLVVGNPVRAIELSAKLRERGFFVPGIRPPSVPEGESLLRLSLTSAHTPEMLKNLLAALEDMKDNGSAQK